MTVWLLTFCVFILALASSSNQNEHDEKVKSYQLDVPGKEPITIIERAPDSEFPKWKDITVDRREEDMELKNLMTHIVHDINGNTPRCYGPSCQEGYNGNEGPHEGYEDYMVDEEKMKNYHDYSNDRLQAITALAAKLKKDKLKADRYPSMESEDDDEDGNGKVYTTWNRLKVKQHKHPYDDKDGWVTLEPVAWSTSKISKWKPNVKKQKPNHWNDNNNRFPDDDRYNSYPDSGTSYSFPHKRPSQNRPGYINNKLQVPLTYDTDDYNVPKKPTWNKPQQSSYSSSWSPDEGRRPHKPSCDSEEHRPNDDTVFYGISDSVVTDHRPSHFPYEYEALHQAAIHKRPMRRPTEVVYAGNPDLDSDYDSSDSRPPYGDGQWVLLSTTKGYRNKKRQRSLNPSSTPVDGGSDFGSVTSHQAVALTVLPIDNAKKNMTTSHGGLLEVEKSFQTVEESKRDMDKKNDLDMSESKPVRRVIRKKVSNVAPDRSTILAAVGAGMVPATMAMVVPMMLGRRRRRRDLSSTSQQDIDNIFYKYN
ncbi:uncharacterized protein LOC113513060 [Galleria mellonella]|uniref:Uncharacterized protein LOC113513060 n=1 Tax=Galleria mellonella TaxID=7137 RepID=A0A6J3C7P4_GALME|nr:uncharacterized protein LOC113513060 [Galleria mellonella]